VASAKCKQEIVSGGRHQVCALRASCIGFGLTGSEDVQYIGIKFDFPSLDSLGETEAVISIRPESIDCVWASGHIGLKLADAIFLVLRVGPGLFCIDEDVGIGLIVLRTCLKNDGIHARFGRAHLDAELRLAVARGIFVLAYERFFDVLADIFFRRVVDKITRQEVNNFPVWDSPDSNRQGGSESCGVL
jgi:hypothetical protein